MSLSKDVPSSFLITPDLLCDSRVRYTPWKAAIFKLAAAQLRSQFPSGCLFLVQTQAEYDAFPLHTDTSGHLIPRPVLVLVPPSLPKASDTVIARETYTRDLAQYVAWVEVQAKLLTAIIASVLPADLLALRDPLYGDLLLDIPTVLAHVAKEHGRVTAEDIAALRATLYEKLALPVGFLTHTLPSSLRSLLGSTSKR